MHVRRRSPTGRYLRVTFDDRPASQDGDSRADGTDQLLFSFVGRTETAPVRNTLAALTHPRGLIINTWCLELMRARSMPLVADMALFWIAQLTPRQFLSTKAGREWRRKLRALT